MAWVAVQPKGRFTSWTQSGTRSWRSFTAIPTKWQGCAQLRTATSSVELENMMGRSPSGRWSKEAKGLKLGMFYSQSASSHWIPTVQTNPGKWREDPYLESTARRKAICITEIWRNAKKLKVYMKSDQPGQLLLSSMKLRLEILTELILSFNEGKLKTETGKVSSCSAG